MPELYAAPTANFVQTSLNGGISDSANTITLNSVANLQAPGYIVVDRIDANGTATPNSREVISFTGISGSDLTGCTRGADNSTARSHANGAIVETTPTVGLFNTLRTAYNTNFTSDGVFKAQISPISVAVGRFIQMDLSSIASIAQLRTTRAAISMLTIATSINASGASLVGITPSGASGSVLTNIGNDKPAVFAPAPASSTDGWTAATDTWTYASATTFTIAGVDRTAIFAKGTRIKLNQSGNKYFVVASSAFSTDTTVTITGGTDYTLANAAITSPFYSYEQSPQGYPGWFAYTVTWGGFSADPSSVTSKFAVDGKTCFVQIQVGSVGTSNNTATTFSIPIAAGVTQTGIPMGSVHDNGTTLTTLGVMNVTATSATASAFKGPDQGGWTNSGAKGLWVSAFYQI